MVNALTKQTQRTINTKKKLLTSALELMSKKGFDNTTIEDISSSANMSVGAFYHHFKSKRDVFFELYQIADNYFQEEVYPLLNDKNCTDKISIYFNHYAKHNLERGLDILKLIFHTSNKMFISKGRYMNVLLSNIISEGLIKGDIHSQLSPDIIAENLLIIARGTVFDWCVNEGNYDLEIKLDQVIKQSLSGLE